MRILLLEDEHGLGRSIKEGLSKNDFAVDWAETGERGMVWAKVNDYDLGIFDLKLAGRVTGLDVCAEVRKFGRVYPIIMLSVTGDVGTKIEALKGGADDYLAKPFIFGELLARVHALLRRERKITGPMLAAGDLMMDLHAHTVTRAGRPLRVSKKQFVLLEYFMRNPGITLTRDMILEHVWDMNADPFTNTVDVHVRFLRKAIDEPFRKKLIKTVHGYGYRLEV